MNDSFGSQTHTHTHNHGFNLPVPVRTFTQSLHLLLPTTSTTASHVCCLPVPGSSHVGVYGGLSRRRRQGPLSRQSLFHPPPPPLCLLRSTGGGCDLLHFPRCPLLARPLVGACGHAWLSLAELWLAEQRVLVGQKGGGWSYLLLWL